ncbi:ATP-binding protein [Anaerocolumna sp. MB42-C2]|uniref:ATP-binding protein n=1 Tax=Anaerocolumna sp. MB42-C2 TaxID=3070997 RepID=UPI0027DFCC97|nr:DnaA/Hda family protein [Anaerocolumna sp. MB42-C2]WMJ88890.1 DnaA/Hda family protein [Anaerocolumna sp. MB42-C2]
MKQNRQPSEHSETEAAKSICPKCKDTGWEFYIKDGYEYSRECSNGCRIKKIKSNKLQFADIPREFESLSVESFKTDCYSKVETREKAEMVKAICRNYINQFNQIKETGKGLYLYSKEKGSGKTRMAVSMANDIINNYMVSAKITTAIRILDEIKNTWNSNRDAEKPLLSEMQLVNDITQVPVLIIDDIGVEKSSPWVDEKFYSILDNRLISKKITIFTSNVRIEDLKLDERIRSRIGKMALPVQFPNESIRDSLARKENNDFLMQLIS